MNRLLLGCIFVVIILASCKTPVSVSKTTASPGSNKSASSAITDSMNNHAFHFEWFSGKAKIEVTDGSGKTEFTANFRIRNDSVIWISISPAFGLEVVRVLITKDSLHVIDRINKEHYSRDYNFFRKYTSLPIDLPTIQNLVEGNPLFLEGKQFDVTVNDSSYLLKWENGAQVNSVTLDKKFMNQFQTITDSASGSIAVYPQQYDIQYNPPFALWRKIELMHPDKTTIVATFSKIKINEPVKFPFNMKE